MNRSDTIGKLAEALAKAQGAFARIEKNRSVTVTGTSAGGKDYQYDFDYADLDAIIEATRPALAENGLMLTQLLGDGPDKNGALTTMLAHSSGEWMAETITFQKTKFVSKNNAVTDVPLTMQELGGQVTYLKRYQRCAFLDVSAETDDDGGVSGDMNSKNAKAKAEEEFDFAIGKKETAGQYGKPLEYWQRWEDAIALGKAEKFMKPTKNKPEGMPAWRMLPAGATKASGTPEPTEAPASAAKAGVAAAKAAAKGKPPAESPKIETPTGSGPVNDSVDDAKLTLIEAVNIAQLTTAFNGFPQEWKRPNTDLYKLFMKRRGELAPAVGKGETYEHDLGSQA